MRSKAKSQQEYRVEILYREPTYELHAGPKAEPYRWTYRVQATNEEQAKSLAIEDFRMLERNSSVGWTRVVSEVRVARAG